MDVGGAVLGVTRFGHALAASSWFMNAHWKRTTTNHFKLFYLRVNLYVSVFVLYSFACAFISHVVSSSKGNSLMIRSSSASCNKSAPSVSYQIHPIRQIRSNEWSVDRDRHFFVFMPENKCLTWKNLSLSTLPEIVFYLTQVNQLMRSIEILNHT